jgi:nucleoid-associated protein YgaU
VSGRRRANPLLSAPGDLERYGLLALAALLLLAIAWLAQLLIQERNVGTVDAPLDRTAGFATEGPEGRSTTEPKQELAEGAEAGESELALDHRADAPGGGHIAAWSPLEAAASAPPPFDFFEPPLRLPGRPAVIAPPPPGARGGERFVLVADGDTLQKIAARELGSAAQWRRLLDWNPGLDPRRLRAGTRIALPPVVAAAPATGATTSDARATRSHQVAAGETLRGLARRYLGDERRFTELLELNRDQLPRPEAMRIGMRIRIP